METSILHLGDELREFVGASLLVFASYAGGQVQVENAASQPVGAPLPEMQRITSVAIFPVGGVLLGPPGCRRSETRRICRSDAKPVERFNVKVVSTRGWGSRLERSELVDGCVMLQVRLGVKHSGPEGRTCHGAEASVILDVMLDGPP